MTQKTQQEDFNIQEADTSAPPGFSFAGEVDSWEIGPATFDIQEPGNPEPPKTSLAGEVENWIGTQ